MGARRPQQAHVNRRISRISRRDRRRRWSQGARELRAAVKENGRYPVTIINRSAAGLEDDERLQKCRAPRLVLTSPPYPGVHVLYHRWQVDGRKEAPLPFMIANKLDGAGSSYYTMGDRKYPELQTYFENIKATMSSVAALADRRTVIVQMVAFSEPDGSSRATSKRWKRLGLTEVFLPALKRRTRRPAMAQRAEPALVQRAARRNAGQSGSRAYSPQGIVRAAHARRTSLLLGHVHQLDHRHRHAPDLLAACRIGRIHVVILLAHRRLIHLVQVEGDVRRVFVQLALNVLLGVALGERLPEFAQRGHVLVDDQDERGAFRRLR